VVEDTNRVDSQVQLERDGRKTAYRCVLCAIADAKADKKNVVIIAPSEKKGKPVTLTRTSGKWTVEPDTSIFVYAKGSHAECQVRYHAISSKAAFDSYVLNNPRVLNAAKTFSLEDLIKKAE
jgi:hypothetical protein